MVCELKGKLNCAVTNFRVLCCWVVGWQWTSACAPPPRTSHPYPANPINHVVPADVQAHYITVLSFKMRKNLVPIETDNFCPEMVELALGKV